MLDILAALETWRQENRRIALATVIQTWGSSPRQAGAKLGINADMGMIGSVSGGCVETAVVSEAIDSLDDTKPRLLNFGVSDDNAWDVGLACGGKISVYVEPLDLHWWQIASDYARRDQAFATATVIDGASAGAKVTVDSTGIIFISPTLDDDLCTALVSTAQTALKQQVSARAEVAGYDVFVDVFQPRPRLVIIGGAHVAMALKDFAHKLGFRVVLIDPRKAFATRERFPDVELISHEYPDKVLPQIGLTPETYIAILTHDPKIDDPALRAALPAHVPYIGVLSSKRTHEKRIERLTEAGIDSSLFDQIRTPIGVDIGAKTPEEIALCIMAEIVAVRNGVAV